MEKTHRLIGSIVPILFSICTVFIPSSVSAEQSQDVPQSAADAPVSGRSDFAKTFADLLNPVEPAKISRPPADLPEKAPPPPQYGKPLADSLVEEKSSQESSSTLAPFRRAGGGFAPLRGITLPRPINIPANANSALKQAAARIPNLSVVSAGLIRGAQPPSDGFSLLKSAGVKTVINLRNEEIPVAREAEEARRAGLNYVNIPMNVFGTPTKQQFQKFLSTVGTAGPVFVHCQFGEDRTGTMVAIYRMAKEGWDANRAYQEMTAMGFKPYLGALSSAVFDYSASLGRPARRPPIDLGSFSSLLRH